MDPIVRPSKSPSTEFGITVGFERRSWTLSPHGALDLASGEQLVEVAAHLCAVTLVSAYGGSVARNEVTVLLDLSGVDFIDSAGLHAVARSCRQLREAGAITSIGGASSPAMKRLIDALGAAVDLMALEPAGFAAS